MKPVDLAIVKALLNRSISEAKESDGGVDGKRGPRGAAGERGEVGKQGEVGKAGKDGVDGLDGLHGKEGLAGKDGRDGQDGKDGRDGLVGKAGSDGLNGRDGSNGKDGVDGKDGRGIKSVKVNNENMLVVTYDDGDMTIAGKVSVTRETTTVGGGLPLGSFGITGTKTNDSGELVIVGTYGKEFNTGFTSPTPALRNPTFTYTDGTLTSIAYSGGATKVLSYNLDGSLNTLVKTVDGTTTTKTMAYNADGTLASITET